MNESIEDLVVVSKAAKLRLKKIGPSLSDKDNTGGCINCKKTQDVEVPEPETVEDKHGIS